MGGKWGKDGQGLSKPLDQLCWNRRNSQSGKKLEFKPSVRENPNKFRNFTRWRDEQFTVLSLPNEGSALVKGLFSFLG